MGASVVWGEVGGTWVTGGSLIVSDCCLDFLPISICQIQPKYQQILRRQCNFTSNCFGCLTLLLACSSYGHSGVLHKTCSLTNGLKNIAKVTTDP